jgi:hypothetical protein
MPDGPSESPLAATPQVRAEPWRPNGYTGRPTGRRPRATALPARSRSLLSPSIIGLLVFSPPRPIYRRRLCPLADKRPGRLVLCSSVSLDAMNLTASLALKSVLNPVREAGSTCRPPSRCIECRQERETFSSVARRRSKRCPVDRGASIVSTIADHDPSILAIEVFVTETSGCRSIRSQYRLREPRSNSCTRTQEGSLLCMARRSASRIEAMPRLSAMGRFQVLSQLAHCRSAMRPACARWRSI